MSDTQTETCCKKNTLPTPPEATELWRGERVRTLTDIGKELQKMKEKAKKLLYIIVCEKIVCTNFKFQAWLCLLSKKWSGDTFRRDPETRFSTKPVMAVFGSTNKHCCLKYMAINVM